MLLRLLDWSRTQEPAVMSGALISGLGTIVALLALWGIPMSNATQTAIGATIPVVVTIVMSLATFIRQFVTPTPKAIGAIATALVTPPPPLTTPDAHIVRQADVILAKADPVI